MDCGNEQIRGEKKGAQGGERVFRVKLMSGSGGEARRGGTGENGRLSISRRVKNGRGGERGGVGGSGWEKDLIIDREI